MSKKSLRSILCVLVIFSFLVVGVISPVEINASSPAAVIGTVYDTAVTSLMDIGVIAKSSSFDPYAKVTRAQMAQIIVRMLKLDKQASQKKGATKFTDVSAKYWASGYINVVTQKGIMSGTSKQKFSPNASTTYDYAVTYLLNALGYKSKLQGKGKWPSNYLVKADALGIIGDAKWTRSSDAAKIGNVSILAWNSLNCATASGSTLLEINFPDYAQNHRKEESIEEVAKNCASTVYIVTYTSPTREQPYASGSGIVIGKNYIVTCSHVIGDAPRFGVVYNDSANQEYDTSGVLLNNPVQDVAIVNSPNKKIAPVKLGDSDKMEIGQKVVTISSPEGIDFKNTVAEGIVSGRRYYNGMEYLQITAAVSHGSSGGGVYNMYGELIGIIVMKDFDGESLNLAIPINDVKKAMSDTSEYNLNLNKSISDKVDSLEYRNENFHFSTECYYDSDANRYNVNLYMYDPSEGADDFIQLYEKISDFRNFISGELKDVNKLLEDNGYKKYAVNLTVEDRNYVYKVDNKSTSVILDTLSAPPPKPMSYSSFTQTFLDSGLSGCTINGVDIKIDSAKIGEVTDNTNKLEADLYISDVTYSNIAKHIENAYDKDFMAWVDQIAAELSQQYPNKDIYIYITNKVGTFDTYQASYDTPPYFSVQNTTTNKWDVYKDLFYCNQSITGSISQDWVDSFGF